jgi:hypothetical protein
MKKTTMVLGGIGLVGLGLAAVGAITVKLRVRAIMKDVPNMDAYIKEVLGDVPYEVQEGLHVPALCKDDQSAIVFKAWDKDMALQLAASPSKQTFKQSIQAMAAHEKGHYVDKYLSFYQECIMEAYLKGNYRMYKDFVLKREMRAWELGRPFAIDKDFYEGLNRNNMRLYEIKLDTEKETMFAS